MSINLPEYDGKTTHGVLVLDDGTQVPFSSGNANAPKPSWVDTVKTYIGNDKIPKKPK